MDNNRIRDSIATTTGFVRIIIWFYLKTYTNRIRIVHNLSALYTKLETQELYVISLLDVHVKYFFTKYNQRYDI